MSEPKQWSIKGIAAAPKGSPAFDKSDIVVIEIRAYNELLVKAEKLAEALKKSCGCKMGWSYEDQIGESCPACNALAEYRGKDE